MLFSRGRLDGWFQVRFAVVARWLAGWSGRDNFWWAKVAACVSSVIYTFVMLDGAATSKSTLGAVTSAALGIAWVVWLLPERLRQCSRLADAASRSPGIRLNDLVVINRVVSYRVMWQWLVLASTAAMAPFPSIWIVVVGTWCWFASLHWATTWCPPGTPVWKRAANRVRSWRLALAPAPAPG